MSYLSCLSVSTCNNVNRNELHSNCLTTSFSIIANINCCPLRHFPTYLFYKPFFFFGNALNNKLFVTFFKYAFIKHSSPCNSKSNLHYTPLSWNCFTGNVLKESNNTIKWFDKLQIHNTSQYAKVIYSWKSKVIQLSQ